MSTSAARPDQEPLAVARAATVGRLLIMAFPQGKAIPASAHVDGSGATSVISSPVIGWLSDSARACRAIPCASGEGIVDP